MRKLLILIGLLVAFQLQGQLVRTSVVASQGGVSGPSYGAEKITNGGFADATGWGVAGSWSIGSGVASFADLANSTMFQADVTMVSGMAINTTYKLEFDVASAGSLDLIFRDQSAAVEYIAQALYGNGHHIIEFTTGGSIGTGGLGIRGLTTSTASGTIDNISLKEKL